MSLAGGTFGATIGAIFGGPLGAIIGGSLGVILTGGSKKTDAAEKVIECYAAFFRCLGKLAKCDGRVSEDEAQFVRELMRTWQLDSSVRQKMISQFNDGRDSSKSFAELVTELDRIIKVLMQIDPVNSRELAENMTTLFCLMVAVDHNAVPQELALLKEAGSILNTTYVVNSFFAQNCSGQQNSDTYGQSDKINSSGNRLEECYKLLDISPDATDAEVKKAYRKKAAEFHPDKVQGTGLSNDFIQFAKEKFQSISNAYETICKARNM